MVHFISAKGASESGCNTIPPSMKPGPHSVRASRDLSSQDEIVRYMSNWECRASVRHPQKASSSTKAQIGQDPRNQSSSSHICRTSLLHRKNEASLSGWRFGSPGKERNASYHHRGEKYAPLVRSDNVKESCHQKHRVECASTSRYEAHLLPRVQCYEEKNASNGGTKDQKKLMMSNEETLPWERRSSETNLTLENHPPEPETDNFENDSSKSSRTSLDGQLLELVGARLSDIYYPQELKSGDFSVSKAKGDTSSGASEAKRSSAREENGSPSSLLESYDENQAENTVNFILNERPHVPPRRFGFHLGKMSRSLSFKDNSAVPQLSSTSLYTGTKTSSGTMNFKIDQANSCSRARSSPLRRLLDPLMKQRGAHLAETVKGPTQDRMPKRSTTPQALLQLTLKNGLLFFKVVANNSSDMLVAAVNKSDSCVMYAFHSVREIKNKDMSSINQGSKSKSCNLGYNMVGRMEISGSAECGSRECVLYSVDRKELAAVIVGNPGRTVHEETRNHSETIVVLPGGVHGLPMKGTPSTLISRWRFGGSCDCGGWDVGCKLRVLVDCKTSSHGLQASEPSSCIDHINLYAEGGEKGNKHCPLKMKPFRDGYYSIELDPSISLLEAFATCVAHFTCLKFPETINVKATIREHFAEAIAEADERKEPTTFEEQIPAYATCPPSSPTGRI